MNWVIRRQGSAAVRTVITGNPTLFGVPFRSGVVGPSQGDVEITVTLANPMPSTDFAVFPSLGKYGVFDGMNFPIQYEILSTSQVRLRWGIPLDSNTYLISYLFIGKNVA